MAQVKTMRVSGNDYAPVDERLKAFHNDNKNGAIYTEIRIMDGQVIEAKAKVTPDVANPLRYFTGSALGQVGREKALEKLETVAVGRALAFAGYLADGRIASAEEMDRFEANQGQPEPVAQPQTETGEVISEAQRKMLYALGKEVYGEEISVNLKRLVSAITKGTTDSIAELTKKQASKLIDGLNAKRAEVTQ